MNEKDLVAKVKIPQLTRRFTPGTSATDASKWESRDERCVEARDGHERASK